MQSTRWPGEWLNKAVTLGGTLRGESQRSSGILDDLWERGKNNSSDILALPFQILVLF